MSADEIREYRGDFERPGKNSPYRDRSVEENLALFEAMKNGVSRVHMLDGRLQHCLLLEFFTEKGIGTAILKEPLF